MYILVVKGKTIVSALFLFGHIQLEYHMDEYPWFDSYLKHYQLYPQTFSFNRSKKIYDVFVFKRLLFMHMNLKTH